LGMTDSILKTYGKKGLYTSTLFDFQDDFFSRLGPALELAQLSQLRAFSVEIWGGPCDKFCIFNVGCAQGFVV
jgi:hypothetical protein